MTRRLRAAGRLGASVVHILHGVAIVFVRFQSYDTLRREACVRWFSTKLLRTLGVGMQVRGTPVSGGVLMVANHISWLDILAMHAVCPQARFVSKADVKHWPLISQLASAAGTLYLERDRKRDALRVVHVIAQSLRSGQMVAVFPEGTTSDGRALLPFHANLLQAAIATESPVQPVALRFSDSTDAVSRAVEFIGDTTLLQSMWRVACGDGVTVRLHLLPPHATGQAERRALAAALRNDITAHLQ